MGATQGKGFHCGVNKAQLLLETTREIADSADEWIGIGILTAEFFVTEGELRLPVQEHALPQTRVCKRIARRPKDEELSTGSHAASSHGRAGAKGLSALSEGASGPYVVGFAADGDAECRPLEVLFSTSVEETGIAQTGHFADLVSKYSAQKEQFVVTLRVEIACVSFKKAHSPFRDGSYVEEPVRRMLDESHTGGAPIDLALFATNYGNCVVEKVFCGGVLSLRFWKVARGRPSSSGSGLPGDEPLEVQVGRDLFNVSKAQRGGDAVLCGPEGRRSTTLEHVEKEVKSWCRGFGLESKARGPTGKNVGQVVRLKLAPFSKVEGVFAPGALTRMDFQRTAQWETAKENLARAARTKQLSELRQAVDQASAVALEDPSLDGLQETRRQLDGALEALRQASRQEDVEALRRALKRSEESGLLEWESGEHEAAVLRLATLLEKRQRSKLQAAADATEIRIDDLIKILCDALGDNFAHLEEFDEAQSKLLEVITGLTQKAKADLLDEEQARAYVESLERLPPEALELARANIAASRFFEAVKEMRQRSEEKRNLELRKRELEGSLRELVHLAEGTPVEDEHYENMAQLLRQVDSLIGEDVLESSSESTVGEALRTLRKRGAAVLEEKRTMDQTVQIAEARLREAILAETVAPEALEAALQDMAVKQKSGALHRTPVSASLLESARKQLVALLRPELEDLLNRARAPGSATCGASSEVLSNARRVLQRMEMSCRPTCEQECAEMADRIEDVQREVDEEISRHNAQEEAQEKLRHCLRSGDPQLIEDALRQAQICGIPEVRLQDHQARLRELRTAERQLQRAMESGDRVHLATALEEASRQGLRIPVVDEAQQRLQSSKTSTLVAAIRQRDYFALGRAIAEAENRSPGERAEISDVLEQAQFHYVELDDVAKTVTASLSSLNYDELSRSLREARRLNVITDDVRKAEGVLSAMDDALEKLRSAVDREPHDLAALQEGLHHARQQGLQAHPVYQQAEEVFAGTCMPAGMEWALEEQRAMWVVLCLRRPLLNPNNEQAIRDQVLHPFTVAVAELCHNAQISPEAEPYPVQYIHHALARITQPSPGPLAGTGKYAGQSSDEGVGAQPFADLQEALRSALEDFSGDPLDGPPWAGEAVGIGGALDAQQFNLVGLATKHAGLNCTSHLLWWLVCIVEWEAGQRLFLASMSEYARRTADLRNEAESTGRSLRTHMMARQAKGPGPPEDDDGVAGTIVEPEIAPEIGPRANSLPMPPVNTSPDARVVAVRSVLEEIDQLKREAEKLQASIARRKATPEGPAPVLPEEGTPDLCWILELLRQAKPRSLEEARIAVQVQQKEASGRARDIFGEAYGLLETRLLQLHYKGRQALDGETWLALDTVPAARAVGSLASNDPQIVAILPLATISSCTEAASSLQDHAFLQILGVAEGRGSSQSIDRCFQRVEVYERFSEKTGTVEDEFEELCRVAVTEARQRCGGRRLIAALKPLLVDLVKRRQCISSMLNTLRNCGLDKVEKNLLRKHLQPRDLLIALTFSSMSPGPSQARMMTLAAKTDSPLPFLFGWSQPPSDAKNSCSSTGSGGAVEDVRRSGGGLQLCMQIHWGALRELFCRPSDPLVLSLGTKEATGKSYLLQYLYALQECHFRGSTQTPLRIHDMPSIDIIGDFAREEPLRGVTLADVHCFDPGEDLCEALAATLSNSAALILLHVSLKRDFVHPVVPDRTDMLQMSDGLARLLGLLAIAGVSCPHILLFLRDSDTDDSGPMEHRRLTSCVRTICRGLGGEDAPGVPSVLAWPVPPLSLLGPTELVNEVKSLRKSRTLFALKDGSQPSLEEALAQATRSTKKMPSMTVLQERYGTFADALQQRRQRDMATQVKQVTPNSSARSLPLLPVRSALEEGREYYGPLARRIFTELDSIGSTEGLLGTLFPVTCCHQQLTSVLQDKIRCINRGREYLEPEDRRRLEVSVEGLDKRIAELRSARQQAPPHALLRTFAQLVIRSESDRIMEFGAYLDDWKQKRRAPLLERKLCLRKELDQWIQELEESAVSSEKRDSAPAPGAATARVGTVSPVHAVTEGDATTAVTMVEARIADLRVELVGLQRRLDEVDVSTDSFWLELMLWHELERIGARRGLREIDESLTLAASRACYLGWVKNGNPVHFLHSSPLQFGAFEPLRWHPQLSGASLFGSDFIGDVLRELDRDLGVDVRRRPLLVISVIGVQSSGKSTLMNYLFGCSFATHVGRCTKGLYISLLETKRELIVILDTEGLLSVEARDDVFDKQVALMTMACSDLVIVNNRGELGRHVGDLFQVCLFALYHLKLARISPAIGFVLQCLSMVNQQQQYEWVATVKRSLEESVQELQQKEKPHSFKLQDLVFLDSESIFVMPSAFNDDVQFGLQVSRPTNLYALKALQLREKVFHWIARAKSSQKQRLRENSNAASGAAASSSSFASLSQWYEHARTVWQTLSMCGTDLLQFRTMRQVLMAQQLQEFCDALVQKQIDGKLSEECEGLIQRYSRELLGACAASDVHAIDNAFRGQLDATRDAVLQEMHHEFDVFVKAHDTKFTDEQVKSDKRFSLMGPMRRKYASVESLWRSVVHLALEQRSMDHLFEEISVRVNDLLLEQGASVNVQNVELVFEEKWSQVMAETLGKMKPNLDKIMQEVVWHFNAALSNLKSQFRKAHIFHGVKSLSIHEIGSDSEVCSSFLLAKKGIGDALVPSMLPQVTGNLRTQVDNLWIKLVDAMRLEVDQQGQMSDAAALKILNRFNSEMETGDQLRQLLHRLGSSFVHRMFFEIAKATMQYRFQIEQQNFQARINEVLGKKQQKLWEIQARVDSGKREVHCAKVWAKTFVDTLDQHFRNAVGRMAQEIVSHISNILTNPGNACELAIERSFTKRNWRHVVMYAIDPTQYLFMEFHKEWEHFKQGLVDQYCQELKSNFGSCLRHAEDRMQGMLVAGTVDSTAHMTMNRLSEQLKVACEDLMDESLASVLCASLPSFPSDADWPLNNLEQFVQFAGAELRRYRANMRQTELTVERRMEVELTRQKANCWKCICGCPARCPGCGTKCNLETENHWPERPHECRRHLYPAFNGWQKQEGRKPFLLHCRAKAQWQIARTRPPIEPGGPERYWDNFQAMLEDEHPDWLDPVTRKPLASMEPLEEYEEDCTTAPESIQREIEENRRAWANCKDALLEHFTSMADDKDIEWLDKYKREGGALDGEEFAAIRDELFAVTPLESLEVMDNMIPMEEPLEGTLADEY